MMYNYPYLNSPFSRRYGRYNYNNMGAYDGRRTGYAGKNTIREEREKQERINNKKQTEKDNFKEENSRSESPLFEIMGIKLYQDDLIILALLFFFYTEGVEDTSLFIVLILLLLS